MALDTSMKQYAQQVQEELKQLIRDLCAIPAPSHLEHQRAAFCKQWFEAAGGQEVHIDEALNAICPWGVTDDNEIVVVMRLRGERYCASVGISSSGSLISLTDTCRY